MNFSVQATLCWTLSAVMVLGNVELVRSCETKFNPFAMQPLIYSVKLLGFWVSEMGLAVRFWRALWGKFLLRHILAHEMRYVIV